MFTINGKEYPCCMSVAMGLIGGKWKTVILYYLKENGVLRYSELKKKMSVVSERTLSLQLKQLQDDQIVKKVITGSKPPLKVEYSLTEFGKTLIPLLQSLEDWGHQVIDNFSENKEEQNSYTDTI